MGIPNQVSSRNSDEHIDDFEKMGVTKLPV
jgi:hypothetical protein